MNDAVYRINLDLTMIESGVMVNMKKLDSARSIELALSEDGKPYTLTSGCRAVLRSKKPDGTIQFNDCTIRDDGIVEFRITNQTTLLVGIVECELAIYGTDNTQLTSASFLINIGDILFSDSETESQNEFTALAALISETNNLDITITDTINFLKARKD